MPLMSIQAGVPTYPEDRITFYGEDFMEQNEHIQIADSEHVSSKEDMDFFLRSYAITPEDVVTIHESIAPMVTGSIDKMVVDFYKWLRTLPVFEQFFAGNDNLLASVMERQEKYWIDMIASDLDDAFMDRRIKLAKTHARIGLTLDSYFAGLAFFNNWILGKIVDKSSDKSRSNTSRELLSLMKLYQVDQALVVDYYVRTTEARLDELIERQAQTILKLATPVSILAEGILLVSIVGIIDSKRAMDIIETTLEKIVRTTSNVALIDISGVEIVDTAVANNLIRMAKTIKLLGCACILSGISPSIAQTIVQLGIDLKDITTKASLKDALEDAYEIVLLKKGKERK